MTKDDGHVQNISGVLWLRDAVQVQITLGAHVCPLFKIMRFAEIYIL